MPEVEITRKVRLSRQQAGERLIALGKALTEGPKSEVEFDGDSIEFVVADTVAWEFELEVDGDEVELEIELKWSDATPAAPDAAAAPTESPARRRTRNARSGDGG